MTKFLALYRSEIGAAQQMAGITPEQGQENMAAWGAWFAKAGDAVVDGGSPVAGGDNTIGGYSILQAEPREALDAVLESHPHLAMGGTIEVLEFLPMPGM